MSDLLRHLAVDADWIGSVLLDQAWLATGAVLIAIIIAVSVTSTRRRPADERLQQLQSSADRQFAEIAGRLSAIAEMTAQRQAEQSRSLNDRLEHVAGQLGASLEAFSRRIAESLSETHRQTGDTAARLNDRIDTMSRHLAQNLDTLTERLGGNVAEAGRRTSDSLSTLNERLALIDDARQSLAELSSEVVSLQGVLSNKQARGAFGQASTGRGTTCGWLPADGVANGWGRSATVILRDLPGTS